MNVTRRITLAALAAGAALTLWGCGKSNDNAGGNAAPAASSAPPLPHRRRPMSR